MDDANRAEIYLVVTCGVRRKTWWNMCRTTTRQEFIRHMDKWLGNEFPQDYTAFFYDKRLKKMIQLDDNEEYYLAPIFDSKSFENQVVGVQPFVTNDGYFVDIFIAVKDATISSNLSSEASLEEFQVRINQLTAEGLNSTGIGDSVSSENSSWPSHDDLLGNDLFDKDVLDSDHDTQEDVESPIAVQNISPTTNLQFQLVEHIRMTHDVCPTLKRLNYVSNMGKKGKSNLAYLSGIRRPNDRGKQIRPILRIPPFILQLLQENHQLALVVACVRETLENGMRVWWIDKHSEFQTKGCTRTTPGSNPLEIPLTWKDIKNGTYKLEVILTHIPGKIGKKRHGDLFHSLDEWIAKQLHSAEHDSDSSRLVFIISSLGVRLMNTIGCSGFIRDPNKKEEAVSTNNETDPELCGAQ